MGKKEEATLTLNLKVLGEKSLKAVTKSMGFLQKKTKQAGNAIRNFSQNVMKEMKSRFVVTAGDLVSAARAVGQAFVNMANKAGEFETVSAAFENLAASQGKDSREMLSNMKKLSAGTISELELMKQANTALLLGLPVDRFGDMLEIARSSAKATGQSMDFMLNSIVTGLGRGCVSGETIIQYIDEEDQLRLETIEMACDRKIKGFKIMALNEEGSSCKFISYEGIEFSGEKPCFKIATRHREIVLTGDHLVFCEDGWIETKDSLGKKIAHNMGYGKGLFFSEILSVHEIGLRKTYDVMNCDTTSFVANGFVVHNSKLMLDNLGIMIDTGKAYEKFAAAAGTTADKLTDVQKKQAFVNEALRIGKKNAEAAGAGQLSLSDVTSQLGAAMENLAVGIGTFLMPAMKKVLPVITRMANGLREALGDKSSFTTNQAVKRIGEISSEIDKLNKKIKSSGGGPIDELFKFKAIGERAELEREMQEISDMMASRIEKQQRGIAVLEEQKRIDAKAKREEEAEAELAQTQELFDRKTELILADDLGKLEAQQAFLDMKLQNEDDHEKRMDILRQKMGVSKKIREFKIKKEELAAQKKHDADMEKLSLAAANGKISVARNLGKLMATAGGSMAKIAFGISKAAAIAQSIVSTNAAVAMARATPPGPPYTEPIAQSTMIAGRLNTATIVATGMKGMEDGGIVRASQGGTPAIIGEGGRDEAVIPLDEAGGLGGGTTIIVNGGLMGDEASAREFVKVIDEELFKLKQSNESVSFEGVT